MTQVPEALYAVLAVAPVLLAVLNLACPYAEFVRIPAFLSLILFVPGGYIADGDVAAWATCGPLDLCLLCLPPLIAGFGACWCLLRFQGKHPPPYAETECRDVMRGLRIGDSGCRDSPTFSETSRRDRYGCLISSEDAHEFEVTEVANTGKIGIGLIPVEGYLLAYVVENGEGFVGITNPITGAGISIMFGQPRESKKFDACGF